MKIANSRFKSSSKRHLSKIVGKIATDYTDYHRFNFLKSVNLWLCLVFTTFRSGLRFKLLILIWLVFIITSRQASAQTYEKSRTLSECFAVSAETEIQISNKYGNIHLIPWEKDSVRFEIELSVKASKQSKVDKTYDYIDFHFKSTKYYVIAQTVFEGKSQFWSDVSDLASTLFSSGTSTQINYTVYLPINNELKINNKFGNIYTTDHSSKVDITLSNGDLKAHSFTGSTKIRINFGNAYIDEISQGNLFINYSDLILDKGEILSIESKSSKIYLTEVTELKLNSKRDKYYIDTVHVIEGETSFSYCNLTTISESLDLKIHYGDLIVKNLPASLIHFIIQASYTDITLHLNEKEYYDVEIIRNEKTRVSYLTELLVKKETPMNGEEELIQVSCKIGKMSTKAIPLKIKSNAGKILLK